MTIPKEPAVGSNQAFEIFDRAFKKSIDDCGVVAAFMGLTKSFLQMMYALNEAKKEKDDLRMVQDDILKVLNSSLSKIGYYSDIRNEK